jgi:hypothetical protein
MKSQSNFCFLASRLELNFNYYSPKKIKILLCLTGFCLARWNNKSEIEMYEEEASVISLKQTVSEIHIFALRRSPQNMFTHQSSLELSNRFIFLSLSIFRVIQK